MLSLVAPEASAQKSEQTDGTCFGNGASGEFEIGIVVDGEGDYMIAMTDMTTGV